MVDQAILTEAERYTSFRIGEMARAILSFTPDPNKPDLRHPVDRTVSLPSRSFQLRGLDEESGKAIEEVRKRLNDAFGRLSRERTGVAHGYDTSHMPTLSTEEIAGLQARVKAELDVLERLKLPPEARAALNLDRVGNALHAMDAELSIAGQLHGNPAAVLDVAERAHAYERIYAIGQEQRALTDARRAEMVARGETPPRGPAALPEALERERVHYAHVFDENGKPYRTAVAAYGDQPIPRPGAEPPKPHVAISAAPAAEAEIAGEALGVASRLGRVAGKLARGLGPAATVVGVASAGLLIIDAQNKAAAAVADGTMTEAQATQYRQAATSGAAVDAVLPTSAAADQVRDTLVRMNLGSEDRDRLQLGTPRPQIDRVRDTLPARATDEMSDDMKQLVRLNAEIKNFQGQSYIDPAGMRRKIDAMERDLYRRFDAMRDSAAGRREVERTTGVPIDADERTTIESPARDRPAEPLPPVSPPPAGLSPDAVAAARVAGNAITTALPETVGRADPRTLPPRRGATAPVLHA